MPRPAAVDGEYPVRLEGAESPAWHALVLLRTNLRGSDRHQVLHQTTLLRHALSDLPQFDTARGRNKHIPGG